MRHLFILLASLSTLPLHAKEPGKSWEDFEKVIYATPFPAQFLEVFNEYKFARSYEAKQRSEDFRKLENEIELLAKQGLKSGDTLESRLKEIRDKVTLLRAKLTVNGCIEKPTPDEPVKSSKKSH